MRTYPIFLKLAGRRAVVVGGGSVGLRRVRSLVEAGAEVTLIAQELAASGAPGERGDQPAADPAPPGEAGVPDGVRLLRRAYRPGDVAGAAVVFACTHDRSLNARIVADARAAGALANAADQPEHCDFYAASTHRAGDVVVAIGTGGAAPAVSHLLRERIAAELPEDLGAFVAALSELRRELQEREPDGLRRMALATRLAGEDGHAAFARGGPAGLRTLLDELEGASE